MGSLLGQSVIVSGAASGIGFAAAAAAVESGARVALLDRDAAGAVAAARRLTTAGAAIAVACDVSDKRHVDRALAQVLDQFGRVDGLVTSAGVERGGPSHLVPAGDWRTTLEINLTGTFLLCQGVLATRYLPAAPDRQGVLSIVCVSSPAAFVGFAGGENAAYAASKGGVSALVRTLAIEYAGRGVRVNAVVPGATETPLMWANVADEQIEAARREVEQAIPLGHLADPAEIAEAIVWLLGEQSRYVTGTHLVCDGGLLAKAAITV